MFAHLSSLRLEAARLSGSVTLHDLEEVGRGNGRAVNEGKLLGGDHHAHGRHSTEALHGGIVPFLDVLAALGKAGVHALQHLRPFGIVNNLGTHVDGLLGVVEVHAHHLTGSNVALVHGTEVALGLAATGRFRLADPLFPQGLGLLVIPDLALAVKYLLGRTAVDKALFLVNGLDREEQGRLAHTFSSSTGSTRQRSFGCSGPC